MTATLDRTAAAVRVLLVETDPARAALTRDLLEPGVPGAETVVVVVVVIVAGPDAALRRLVGEAFDAVLLAADPASSDDAGLAVTVRAFAAAAPEVPVIVLGDGDDDPEATLRAVRAGAQDVLPGRDRGEAGRLNRALGLAIERHRRERDLARRAHRDPLTGLANRDLFCDRLAHAAARAEREHRPLALLYLDLDGFKRVNDALGHGVGDRLLAAMAERLVHAVRRTDTVARLGGDEFGIVLEGVAHAEDAALAARKLLDALSEPFAIDGHRIHVTASIGIGLYPGDAARVDDLLTLADTAMYRAKECGPGLYTFYTADMNTRARERLEQETALRSGLEREEFELLFQPQVEPSSGRVSGIEVLLRWRHPGRGWLEPEDFIRLAEQTGLIVPIGEWALRRTCAQGRAWRDAGLPPIPLAVNLSEIQLRQGGGLATTVAAILAECGLAPGDLELELVERLPVEEIPVSAAHLAELRRLGVRVAMDDFGTGSFSLSHLRAFPLDTLKLDRSLVHGIDAPGGPGTDRALVAGLIDLAHGLGLRVVAEGVETAAQLAFLRQRHCDAVQGYLISPPLEADALADWLGAREPAPL